jgi:ubiquinone/menaquinone biosynthesis C-methylase UbiE
MDGVPDEMLRHYAGYDERGRLGRETGPLEEARTREIALRHLPPPPARVLDVGGGPGAYSHWLARLGYQVHLVDPVAHHVEAALAAADRAHPLASTVVGAAQHLDHPDQSADAVLLMGPLYHLPERSDRVAALREARRVLRPGGPLLAAAISRFASALDGLGSGLIDDPIFREILDRDLREGQHRNPTGNPAYFTTSFFHLPAELRAELSEAGLCRIQVAAVEGPAWVMRDFSSRWADPHRREVLLALLRRLETEPDILGASRHLLAIGFAPAPPGDEG